jgi:hypothetical protein
MISLESYVEKTDGTYSQRVSETFSIVAHELGTVSISGPCPRCADEITITMVDSVVRSGSSGGATTTSTTDTFVCNCEEAHPGRPDGMRGCGAYWKSKIVRGTG